MMSTWERESPVTLRPRWISDSPCPGEIQVVTSVTMSMCGEVKTRDNKSGWVTVSEQCNHILMLPRCVPGTPGPGEAQVGPET